MSFPTWLVLNVPNSYLPSLPYQDNATLHLYAGLISLYLAQGPVAEGGRNEPGHINPQSTSAASARSHFEHARNLDPDNPIAQAFIDKANKNQPSCDIILIWLQIAMLTSSQEIVEDSESDEEMSIDDTNPKRKRMKSGAQD